MVLHTGLQILYAHGTGAYEEEGSGVSLDVRRQSKLFWGKSAVFMFKTRSFSPAQ
jgi:hypothetical protein